MKKAADNTLCISRTISGRSTAVEDPYVPGDALNIVLTGYWSTGGLFEFVIDGQPMESFRFSAAPWSVLVNLTLAAIHSQSSHWFNSHVATRTLAASLVAHGVLQDAAPEKIHKLVNLIRTELAKSEILKLSAGAELTGKQWAYRLIRSRKGPGYRIALPPKNLRLFIGETEYEPQGESAREREGSGELAER